MRPDHWDPAAPPLSDADFAAAIAACDRRIAENMDLIAREARFRRAVAERAGPGAPAFPGVPEALLAEIGAVPAVDAVGLMREEIRRALSETVAEARAQMTALRDELLSGLRGVLSERSPSPPRPAGAAMPDAAVQAPGLAVPAAEPAPAPAARPARRVGVRRARKVAPPPAAVPEGPEGLPAGIPDQRQARPMLDLSPPATGGAESTPVPSILMPRKAASEARDPVGHPARPADAAPAPRESVPAASPERPKVPPPALVSDLRNALRRADRPLAPEEVATEATVLKSLARIFPGNGFRAMQDRVSYVQENLDKPGYGFVRTAEGRYTVEREQDDGRK